MPKIGKKTKRKKITEDSPEFRPYTMGNLMDRRSVFYRIRGKKKK